MPARTKTEVCAACISTLPAVSRSVVFPFASTATPNSVPWTTAVAEGVRTMNGGPPFSTVFHVSPRANTSRLGRFNPVRTVLVYRSVLLGRTQQTL